MGNDPDGAWISGNGSDVAHFFVLLVEQGREAEFHDYCQTQRISVVCWLDGSESLGRLEEAVTIG